MNWKTFTAGVAVGVVSTVAVTGYYKDTSDENEGGSEFDEYPPDEMICREEIPPSDVRESLDNTDDGGSSIELGNPDEDLFEDIMEPFTTFNSEMDSVIEDMFGEIDSMETLEDWAEEELENRIIASLETEPKDWDELKNEIFGNEQLPEMFEVANIQAMDEALTRLRENDEIRQREDTLYELTE